MKIDGSKFKEARAKSGASAFELAKAAKYKNNNVTRIYQIEANGVHEVPDIRLAAMCRRMGVGMRSLRAEV
jgi:DNA-binding XRE family transcriptional regulator